MNRRFDSHFFLGKYSPLSLLTGAGLIIMASSRFAFALVCAGALVFVYALSAVVYSGARPIMPVRGRMIILLFLSAFLCGFYMLLVGLLNPLLILGTSFYLILVPPFIMASGFFEASESEYTSEVFKRAILEAVVLAGLILGFALIREPLGMGTLSFPGGSKGFVELFDSRDGNASFSIRFLSVSGGGLLLLGYGVALFRRFMEHSGNNMHNTIGEDR